MDALFVFAVVLTFLFISPKSGQGFRMRCPLIRSTYTKARSAETVELAALDILAGGLIPPETNRRGVLLENDVYGQRLACLPYISYLEAFLHSVSVSL